VRKDKPVTLPPGRARLATNPLATGSDAAVKTMGVLFGGQAVGCVRRHEDIELERGQFGRDSGGVARASRRCTGSRPPGCDPRHNRGRAAPRGTPLAGGGYRTGPVQASLCEGPCPCPLAGPRRNRIEEPDEGKGGAEDEPKRPAPQIRAVEPCPRGALRSDPGHRRTRRFASV
jgi:hypothetical protein